MRRPLTRRAACALVAAAVVAHALPAFADDDKHMCIAASERAQTLRLEGKLIASLEQLAVCGKGVCPAIVRQDCTQWMSEVLASLPSVVVGARVAGGQDLVAVKVSIDGTLAAEKLDGRAIPIDPGVHTFRYETEGKAPITEQLVIRTGEKNRALSVVFPGSAHRSGALDPTPPPSKSSSLRVSGFILGGLGLISLGAALYLDLDATDTAHNLRTSCAPGCPQSQVDSVRGEYTNAWVALGIGVVALGLATYMLLLNPSSDPPHPLDTAFRF